MIADSLLLQKYQVLDLIGKSEYSEVYLTEHCTLHQKRVVKCIHKSQQFCQNFLKEMKFLKNLRHAGIPVLYDCEEDEHYFYIIEEYIAGKSYKKRILKDIKHKLNQILQDFMQICEIIAYLHQQKPYPILYLDLKPDHIIVSEKGVWLLDFGSAIERKGKTVSGCCMGTKGFASPELVSGKELDERTDIYSIGAVLLWCLTGQTAETITCKGEIFETLAEYPLEIKTLVGQCLEQEPQNRYSSAQEIYQAITAFLNQQQESKSSYRIAVVGSQSRVGTTHFASALTYCLNFNNRKCLYAEKTESAFLMHLYETGRMFQEKNGILQSRYFYGLPKYGDAVLVDDLTFPIIVEDYGSLKTDDQRQIQTADICIAVVAVNPEELAFTKQLCLSLKGLNCNKIVYIINFGASFGRTQAEKILADYKYMQMPYCDNPFCPSKEMKHFMQKLIQLLFGKHDKGGKVIETYQRVKKIFGNSWRRRK